MRTKVLWVLLAVSLLANVALVGGALYSLYGRDRSPWHTRVSVEDVTERLQLTPAQHQGLLELSQRVGDRREAMREDRSERRTKYLAELAKPSFDRARMVELLEDYGAERREFFADMSAELHAYLATLGPEQRAQFLEMAQERGFLRGLFKRSKDGNR